MLELTRPSATVARLGFPSAGTGAVVWPGTATGVVSLTAAQLSMPMEGIEWRRPERRWRPRLAG